MVKVCPVTDKLINEKVTRLVALFTFIISSLFIVTDQVIWLFVVLAADFVVRGFWKGDYSLILFTSVWLSEKLKIKPKAINAGPKIFAARIGSMLTMLVIIFHILNFTVASMAFAGILAFFAFLESVFNYCVACKLYPYVLKLGF
jgi:hypothetical protein